MENYIPYEILEAKKEKSYRFLLSRI